LSAPEETPREGEAQNEFADATLRDALLAAAGVTVASALAVATAFSPERAGGPWMLGSMGLVYAALGAWAVMRLKQRGELYDQLRPAAGDLSIGAIVAAVLYGVAMAVHVLVTSPPSPRVAWIMRVYLALGDPTSEHRHLVGGVVFIVAALEELVWRGLVMRMLAEPLGPIRAWLVQAFLFGLAHVPTVILLGDPRVGPNPLLVLAGFTYSLVWGRVAMRWDRLPPALFAHALFTWGAFEFPIWRP
jgi:hypothetical protein